MQPLFQQKRVLIKLATFCDSKTKAIYLNLVIVYESKLKIKVTSLGHFSKSCLLQQLFTKKGFAYNEIIQLLHNYKCYGVDQSRFRKPSQSSAKNVKNNYPKKTRSFSPDVQFITTVESV